MAKRKKGFQPFSIAFLDCICCGFGAVILLFVLTSGKKEEDRFQQQSDVEMDLGKLRLNIEAEESTLRQLVIYREELKKRLQQVKITEDMVADSLENKTIDLRALLIKLAEIEELRDLLLGELENLPTKPEEVPIPVPRPLRRQYLTEFKLDGERVLFLVEASGGMLDDTFDGALDRLPDTDDEKRAAPKWVRTMKSAQWLLTALRAPTTFQLYFYNNDANSIFPTRATEWLEIADRKTVAGVLQKMQEVVPTGRANLEKAFFFAGAMKPPPDVIIHITDGLPTQSDTYPAGTVVDETQRIQMYNAAVKNVPLGIPINTIMMPMTGDPSAPAFFWLLATKTNGSFICPAPDWPSI